MHCGLPRCPSSHPGPTCHPKWNADPVDTGLDHAHLGSSLGVLYDLGPVAYCLWPLGSPSGKRCEAWTSRAAWPELCESPRRVGPQDGRGRPTTCRDPSGWGVAMAVELPPTPTLAPTVSEYLASGSTRTEISPLSQENLVCRFRCPFFIQPAFTEHLPCLLCPCWGHGSDLDKDPCPPGADVPVGETENKNRSVQSRSWL